MKNTELKTNRWMGLIVKAISGEPITIREKIIFFFTGKKPIIRNDVYAISNDKIYVQENMCGEFKEVNADR